MLMLFLTVALVHIIALMSPGPDFFLLLNHTVAHGMRAGLLTALGIACANGVFIVAARIVLQKVRDDRPLPVVAEG